MTRPTKKVGEQLTLAVAGNVAKFREDIDRGLRRQGYITNAERAARSAPWKGCQKLSRVSRIGLQGSRNELAELLPPDAAPGALEYLQEKWGERQAELGAVEVELPTDYMPDPDPVWHAPPSCTKPPVDRRGVWEPLSPAAERPLRAAMYRLRDGMRPISQPRCQACGRAIVSQDGNVGVVVTEDGRVKLEGLAHCGSVWECPTCQMKILQARAAEVAHAVEQHGSERVAMLTLTIRHGAGDDLRALQQKVSRAFAAFSRSRVYRGGKLRHGFKAGWMQRTGVIGRIRAVEVTHGPNGWHPHLHVLFFFDRRVPVSYTETREGRRASWHPSPADRLALLRLWQAQVRRILGERHVPDDAHALAFTLASDGEYIAKLGLELADPANKKGRKPGHRTPWQIAADFVAEYNKVRDVKRDGSPECDEWIERNAKRVACGRDAKLWRSYCRSMRGSHRLVWSNGLKRDMGVLDLTDEDVIANDEDPRPGDRWIGTIPHYVWKAIRDERIRGVPAPYFLLCVAEQEGAQAFELALLKVAAGEY